MYSDVSAHLSICTSLSVLQTRPHWLNLLPSHYHQLPHLTPTVVLIHFSPHLNQIQLPEMQPIISPGIWQETSDKREANCPIVTSPLQTATDWQWHRGQTGVRMTRHWRSRDVETSGRLTACIYVTWSGQCRWKVVHNCSVSEFFWQKFVLRDHFDRSQTVTATAVIGIFLNSWQCVSRNSRKYPPFMHQLGSLRCRK